MPFVRTLVAVLLACVAAPALAQGKWAKLAPFPEPSEELLGASAGGKLYVFCGLAPGWVPKGLVYEYDPGATSGRRRSPWRSPRTTSPSPSSKARSTHSAASCCRP